MRLRFREEWRVAGSGRSSSLVPLVNGAVAALLLVVVAAVALVVRPPAPPGIAEFAPQAAKPISKAPSRLGSRFGGNGACAVGTPCTGGRSAAHRPGLPHSPVGTPPTGAPPPIGIPSSLQCFVWPDGAVTQTFDPQSPPCVADWPGAAHGNGGATAPGVTASTVTVAVPGLDKRPEYGLSGLVSFLNSHYEMYGRQVKLVGTPITTADNSWEKANAQIALARGVIAQHPFAAAELPGTTYPSVGEGGTSTEGAEDESPYRRTLAAAHVLSTQAGTWSGGTAADLSAMGSYGWDVDPPLDTVERNLAEIACKSLVKQPAKWAGSSLSSTTRKFDVLYSPPSSGIDPPTAPLVDAIQGCGGGPVSVTQADTNSSTASTEAVLKDRNNGVTTIICLSHGAYCSFYMQDATQIGYEPEWVILGTNFDENEGQWQEVAPPDQGTHLFGMATWDKLLPPSSEPGYQAQGAAGGSVIYSYDLADAYHNLTLIADGIQTAGPHLTAASFTAGIRAAAFPNPGAAGVPSYQGTIAAAGGNVLVHDLGMLWYSATAPEYNSSGTSAPGGFCYLSRGRRYALGGWPAGPLDLFDQNQCR